MRMSSGNRTAPAISRGERRLALCRRTRVEPLHVEAGALLPGHAFEDRRERGVVVRGLHHAARAHLHVAPCQLREGRDERGVTPAAQQHQPHERPVGVLVDLRAEHAGRGPRGRAALAGLLAARGAALDHGHGRALLRERERGRAADHAAADHQPHRTSAAA